MVGGVMSSINIPDDVLMEILARLPVKCIIKCKCVCKSWSVLVENRSFIAKHHQTQAALNDSGCILIKRGLDDSHFDIFSLLCSKGSTVSYVDLVLPFIVERESMPFVRLIGPCDGLFCAINERNYFLDATPKLSYDITIWNPATREFKILPSYLVPCSPPNYSQWASVGFGFDSITNDYKVVRIWNVLSHEEGEDHISKVEVWNLSDNAWRQIDAIPPVLLSPYTTYHVYRDGRFYWQGFSVNSPMIVWFDMATEVFNGVELPDDSCVRVGQGFWEEMFELNGSIAVSCHPVDVDESDFEIWTMNEFGEHISWSKYMTVEFPIGVGGRPYGFWKNNEILLGYFKMQSFDPRTKINTDLGVYVCSSQQVVVYNESLVSIK